MEQPDSETDLLAYRFCERTLPKVEWTHQAHLKVGLWHLLRHHHEKDSLDLLRCRIKEYNTAVGTRNSESSGYHETITRFYVRIIGQFLRETDRTLPIDELARELIERYGDRGYPFRYYTRERLMSTEARLGWIEPDLIALEE